MDDLSLRDERDVVRWLDIVYYA